MFKLFYKKNDNTNLFKEFNNIGIKNVQNYIPLYGNFFNLQENNYGIINLNQKYHISSVKKTEHKNIFNCELNCKLVTNKNETFFKFSPLIDPVKYMVGKYKNVNDKKTHLPQLSSNKCIKKVLDPNNAAYVDGFFTYLTSNLLHHHKFIHGLDFYGSFLGIHENFKINIFDDLEYLNDSEYFHEHKNKLFKIDEIDSDLFFDMDTRNYKRKLKIEKNISNNSILSLRNETFDDLFIESKSNQGDIIEKLSEALIFQFDLSNNLLKNKSNPASSKCSSRSSYTSNEDNNHISEIDDIDTIDTDDSNSEYTGTSISSDIECMATMENFPVQIICLEKMEATLDSLLEKDISIEEWRSSLFQVIMILNTYQKMFNFTHNDLHTNNIMFNTTEKEYLYYKFDGKYYKVPTYGRIFKIIDFGRAIYSFNGKFICSDSFHPKGDAATQYNIEPYFNKNKPRLEPNPSFDLCRLACALYDYFLDDVDDVNTCGNPIASIIDEWCRDDKGRNILYKNCGEERYPDFKLYKMIARTVHKHTPQSQLDNIQFQKYRVKKKKIQKKKIIDIDSLPIYI
jgi:hypothetical protein